MTSTTPRGGEAHHHLRCHHDASAEGFPWPMFAKVGDLAHREGVELLSQSGDVFSL